MSRSRTTMGLDQLGPARSYSMKDVAFHPAFPHVTKGLNARALESSKSRDVKVTLSDHLFSSDEIKDT